MVWINSREQPSVNKASRHCSVAKYKHDIAGIVNIVVIVTEGDTDCASVSPVLLCIFDHWRIARRLADNVHCYYCQLAHALHDTPDYHPII